jgi:hypothetical protein
MCSCIVGPACYCGTWDELMTELMFYVCVMNNSILLQLDVVCVCVFMVLPLFFSLHVEFDVRCIYVCVFLQSYASLF